MAINTILNSLADGENSNLCLEGYKNPPYVVPCPLRIHNMFTGSKRVHFDNVNAMLGIKIEVGLFQ